MYWGKEKLFYVSIRIHFFLIFFVSKIRLEALRGHKVSPVISYYFHLLLISSSQCSTLSAELLKIKNYIWNLFCWYFSVKYKIPRLLTINKPSLGIIWGSVQPLQPLIAGFDVNCRIQTNKETDKLKVYKYRRSYQGTQSFILILLFYLFYSISL